jgi:hypothetical protein
MATRPFTLLETQLHKQAMATQPARSASSLFGLTVIQTKRSDSRREKKQEEKKKLPCTGIELTELGLFIDHLIGIFHSNHCAIELLLV